MKNSETILQRQKYRTRFKNEDMDFTFNWGIGISNLIGLSTSQLFYAVNGIKDGSPSEWCSAFAHLAKEQLALANQNKEINRLLTAQAYMGAAYALKAELQYFNPLANAYLAKVEHLEETFMKGIEALGVPMTAVNLPFERAQLPAYYLEQSQKGCPTLLMIGGGDTSREDLFYFAGYPGWKRGYNVLMVDLPGQGKLPSFGQHFRVDMEKPITAAIDWLENHAKERPEKLAIYGVSGGGYFTAQGVAHDKRIKAWIASTPITDVAAIFRKEFGAALKTPNWLINTMTKLAGRFNKGAEINLKKYAWQFGTDDFAQAIDRVFKEAVPVNSHDIHCPCLFLLGESEAAELAHQTQVLYQDLTRRGLDVTMRVFTAAEGADAHCQVNNLRLAHNLIFNWLDKLFDYHMIDEAADLRSFC